MVALKTSLQTTGPHSRHNGSTSSVENGAFVTSLRLHTIHKTNGLVERLNKTLKSVLSAYINLEHDDWDEGVAMAAFAINSARQSTRYTPFELLYGRSPALPIDYVLPTIFDPPESRKSKRAKKLKGWREDARRLISIRQTKQKKVVDARRK